jgi:hypothetical protein
MDALAETRTGFLTRDTFKVSQTPVNLFEKIVRQTSNLRFSEPNLQKSQLTHRQPAKRIHFIPPTQALRAL